MHGDNLGTEGKGKQSGQRFRPSRFAFATDKADSLTPVCDVDIFLKDYLWLDYATTTRYSKVQCTVLDSTVLCMYHALYMGSVKK